MARVEQKKKHATSRPVKKSESSKKLDATTRKKTRGATRSPDKKNAKPVRWGRYVVATFALVVIANGVMRIDWAGVAQKAGSATHRPVKSVVIEGEFSFISREKMQALLTDRLTGDFVDIDLRDVKSSIEANPWIHSVSIQRIWPDSLKVIINEERPIARWGESGFINREGLLIKAETHDLLNNLPLLSGVESKSVELTQNYLLFTELLSKSDLKVAGIQVDEKYSWEILLDKNIQLKLGQGDIEKKLENFLFVYEKYLKDVNNDAALAAGNEVKRIKSIDMRYDQGMAVQWETLTPQQSLSSGKKNLSQKKSEKLAAVN